MRFRAVIWCCAMAFLPQLALAERPPGEVGALQAVYDFCVRIDPTQRGDFDRQADALFKGLTPAKVAALQQSAEYRRGYQLLAAALPDIKGKDAVTACQAISDGHEPKNAREEHPGR